MAHPYIPPTVLANRVAQMGSRFASQYIPRWLYPNTSALTVGSGSVQNPKLTLTNHAAAIEESSRTDAEAKRSAAELGLTINPRNTFKNLSFGHCTEAGNSRQGRCKWHVFPVITPAFADQLLLQQFSDLWDINSAIQLHYAVNEVMYRNQMDTTCEIDLWLMHPKLDVPIDAQSGGVPNANYFLGDNPQFIQDCYDSDFLPPMNSAVGAAGAAWQPASLPYNDWRANPYEAPRITEIFDLEYVHNAILNPGDQASFEFGVGRQLLYPFGQLVLPGVEAKSTTGFESRYGLMRRFGPYVLMRVRGTLSHDESLQASEPGNSDGINMSLFNLEHVQCRTFCYNVVDTTSNFLGHRSTNSGPFSAVNLCTAANSQQWFQKQPFEGSSNA